VRLSAVSPTVPAVWRKELARLEQQLVAGKAGPFVGRLVDQAGTLRQARGALGDDAIARMDWFVQGVEGTLPRR
jgi:basic membrane protein A